eukprot:Skav214393  [mRNA]  locus=scaffold2495:13832:16061:- [translate_table: standard]
MVAIHHQEEAALHIRRQLIEHALAQNTCLVVEIVTQNGKHVHAGVFVNRIEHGHRAREGLELLGIGAVDPLGGDAGVGPKHCPNPLVLCWQVNLHRLPSDLEDVLPRLDIDK